MDIDIDTYNEYLSKPPVVDPETGMVLNWPLGLLIPGGEVPKDVLDTITEKRKALGIVVADDLLNRGAPDPDEGRSTFDLLDEAKGR